MTFIIYKIFLLCLSCLETALLFLKSGEKKVKVFKKHIRVPLKTQNQCFRPLTHKEGTVTRHLAQGPRLPIDENIGCNAGDPVTERIREVAQISSPMVGIKAEGRQRKHDTSRAFLPRGESLAQRCQVAVVTCHGIRGLLWIPCEWTCEGR